MHCLLARLPTRHPDRSADPACAIYDRGETNGTVMEFRVRISGSVRLGTRWLDHRALRVGLFGDKLSKMGGRPGDTVVPSSESRTCILASARAMLISLLSVLTISADVF